MSVPSGTPACRLGWLMIVALLLGWPRVAARGRFGGLPGLA